VSAAALFGLLLLQPQVEVDSYGVPKIQARNAAAAYKELGRRHAMDRLWQMEMARRLASGRLSEILPEAKRSDQQVLKLAFTESELDQQIAALPAAMQTVMTSYVEGVNQGIQERTAAKTLPSRYDSNKIAPEPWTLRDSAGIMVTLIRQFGQGGAGELRTMAMLEYLKTQKVKGSEVKVLNDLTWQNDPASTTTLDPKDDKVKPKPLIASLPMETITEEHLAQLPRPNLLELAAGLSLALQEAPDLMAKSLGVAHQWGSYAVAVDSKRSRTGKALLLGAPQMGHPSPSPVYEAALIAPGLAVQGMTVPGIPWVLAGTTTNAAWTLTTGAADVEDIVATKLQDKDTLLIDDKPVPLQRVTFQRKGFTVTQERTPDGPVVLSSGSSKSVFSLRSALRGKELAGFMAVHRMAEGQGRIPLVDLVRDTAPCFNLFTARTNGTIGWRFTGAVPLRPLRFDPRLPLPAGAASAWRGMIPAEQMPWVENPSKGIIHNWNGKPAAWWPNLDTPVWGRYFRGRLLGEAIPAGLLGRGDLEKAAWNIARRDTASPREFAPLFAEVAEDKPELEEAFRLLQSFDARAVEGSDEGAFLSYAIRYLREEIFLSQIGNLTGPNLFNQALQPEVLMRVMIGRTEYKWLEGRSKDAVVEAALKRALAEREKQGSEWGFRPGVIRYTAFSPQGVIGAAPVTYSNRGTFIQITEMTSPPTARNVLAPGNAEEGAHALDQTPLAAQWRYKAAHSLGE
jgi:penicillin G amidase